MLTKGFNNREVDPSFLCLYRHIFNVVELTIFMLGIVVIEVVQSHDLKEQFTIDRTFGNEGKFKRSELNL